MNKRQIKKALALFNCTMTKTGEIKGKKTRRYNYAYYLNYNHPQARNYWGRLLREQARVVPKLLSAPLHDEVMKRELRHRALDYDPGHAESLPIWVERGGRPRRRLLSSIRWLLPPISAEDWAPLQYEAKHNARVSTLLKANPKALGKRV